MFGNKESSEGNEKKQIDSNIISIQDQKNVVLTLQKIGFDDSNEQHRKILKTVKISFANHLP